VGEMLGALSVGVVLPEGPATRGAVTS
jgi:hypothetical protein